MPGPLEGLKKATSIGPDPNAGLYESLRDPSQWLKGEMPIPPGIAQGISSLGSNLLKFIPRRPEASISMVEQAPAVQQVMPGADDVMGLINQLKGNLARVPQAGTRANINLPTEMQQPAVKALKEMNPYSEEMVSKYLSRMR